MMEFAAPLLAYAAALAIAAAIPGPGIAALLGQSLAGGLRASLFFLVGLALGDVVYLTFAVAGLAVIAQTFAGAFLVVKVLGGAYLVYLAYKIWTSETSAMTVRRNGGSAGIAAVLTGFTVTMGNPKTIIFYLALLPTVVDLKAIGPSQWGALSAVTVIVLAVTLIPYAVLADRARSILGQSSSLRRLKRYAAGFIGGAGVLILGQAASAIARRG
ncbi:LysE family translocator [Fulvimarina sp. MAC8]|uniref:LysE family translocator n=1 Tax=Fulvimarina sp. MAC8 TaxID=3162874 RepID=UPI0032EDC777